MQHKLSPNFLKFFTQELKRWTAVGESGSGQLGLEPKIAITEMAERAKKAIQKDLDEERRENESLNPDIDEDANIIKESGSEHPIK